MIVWAVVFAASAITTVLWCGSMSAMPGMPWMQMPGQTWLGAAATFIGMWSVMMVAMMTPVLAPRLVRYRAAVATWVAGGYFVVWTLAGAAIYPLGLLLAAAKMRSPLLAQSAPYALGVLMAIAGMLQFTAWKRRQLACCRADSPRLSDASAGDAWSHGIRLGMRCVSCCAGLTAVLLAVGVMDLRAMAAVMVLICAERLAPAGESVARGVGMVLIVSGVIYAVSRLPMPLA